LKNVALNKIRIDGGTQPRAEISQLVVDDYAEAMRAGIEFPPVTLFFDGVDHWLADGFHRFHAARSAGRKEIAAKVEKGTQRDAILFSVGANADHGLRRTNADKRRAVGILLADTEWAKRSDRWIAEKCGVSNRFIGMVRAEAAPTVNRSQLVEAPRLGQDGRERKLPTPTAHHRLSDSERAALRAVPDEPLDDEQAEVFHSPAAVREVLRALPVADDRAEVRALERLPAATQAAVVERLADGAASSVREAIRQSRREDLPAPVLPTGPKRYRVIYADPPWQYNDSRAGLEGYAATAAEDHYPTMSVAQLCALDVTRLAAPDAVLFCWATFPLLDDALQVVSEWGFKYKTAFVWSKGRPNFGHYHNASAELLLVCTRGSCTPDADKREQQVQAIERTGRHSAKPEDFRALIDRLYTNGNRIELFRRGDAPAGWDVWGNEAAA
jgi:N6-adenosine-specific RNA methylase IME4